MEFDDLMCLNDIAKMLGVTRQRVSQLYHNHKLPNPLGKKGSTVLWLKSDITDWFSQNSRIYYQRYFPGSYKPFTKQTGILSQREIDVLIRYVNKKKKIHEELDIKKGTVYVFLRHIRKKLGVSSAKEIAQKALELGLISDEPAILTNKIRCKHCGDIIESTHVHDFETCSCGRVSVDGGLDYLRRVFQEDGDYEELSTFEGAK